MTSVPSETMINDLELSVRAQNCLRDANIRNVSELSQRTETQLGKMRNMGRRTVKEIKEALNTLGTDLAEE